jgi:hypothetical protein
VVEREYLSGLAVAVADRAEFAADYPTPLEPTGVVARLRELVRLGGPAGIVSLRRSLVPTQDLQSLLAKLEGGQTDLLRDPWPTASGLPFNSGRLFDYSPTDALARVRAVYEGAGAAYVELQEALLPRFGDLLGHRAVLPAVLEGSLQHSSTDGGDFGASAISYYFRPLPRNSDDLVLSVNLSLDDEQLKRWPFLSPDDRAEALEELTRLRPNNPFVEASYRSQVLPPSIWGRRPATHVAVGWLLEDLKDLGWVTNPGAHVQLK